jgi:hypothetical protein
MASYKLARHRLATPAGLSWRDGWTLAQAWILLLLVDLSLGLLPFRRIQQAMAKVGKRGTPVPIGAPWFTIQRHLRLVRAAARHHLYPMGCLRQSLVLQSLLARRGIRTDLRMGVRKEGQRLSAHAWLECAGRPIGEAESISLCFAPLVGSAER